jgi:hypothetical protein
MCFETVVCEGLFTSANRTYTVTPGSIVVDSICTGMLVRFGNVRLLHGSDFSGRLFSVLTVKLVTGRFSAINFSEKQHSHLYDGHLGNFERWQAHPQGGSILAHSQRRIHDNAR